LSNPSSVESSFRIFFACPISDHIDPFTRRLQPAYEQFVRSIYALLQDASRDIFLALEREKWGQNLMAPDTCTPLDFAEMERCDVVVAYPGKSCGVAVELGWASALGKPIILLIDENTSTSPLVRGIGSLPGARVHTISLNVKSSQSSLDMLRSELLPAVRQARSGATQERNRVVLRLASSGGAPLEATGTAGTNSP
jgi:nucleoside 2-deoxyribosyltransferase